MDLKLKNSIRRTNVLNAVLRTNSENLVGLQRPHRERGMKGVGQVPLNRGNTLSTRHASKSSSGPQAKQSQRPREVAGFNSVT